MTLKFILLKFYLNFLLNLKYYGNSVMVRHIIQVFLQLLRSWVFFSEEKGKRLACWKLAYILWMKSVDLSKLLKWLTSKENSGWCLKWSHYSHQWDCLTHLNFPVHQVILWLVHSLFVIFHMAVWYFPSESVSRCQSYIVCSCSGKDHNLSGNQLALVDGFLSGYATLNCLLCCHCKSTPGWRFWHEGIL